MADKADKTPEPAQVVTELADAKKEISSTPAPEEKAAEGETQEEAAASGAPEAAE